MYDLYPNTGAGAYTAAPPSFDERVRTYENDFDRAAERFRYLMPTLEERVQQENEINSWSTQQSMNPVTAWRDGKLLVRHLRGTKEIAQEWEELVYELSRLTDELDALSEERERSPRHVLPPDQSMLALSAEELEQEVDKCARIFDDLVARLNALTERGAGDQDFGYRHAAMILLWNMHMVVRKTVALEGVRAARAELTDATNDTGDGW